ncbi:hypothetical protein E0F91_13355 [Flavobacterium sandaracinum]|uniref:Uncharacterized protein n=1 Tax=Flavobacterium sandaracinum TaxID=2541733 RepID=A0A4R5CT63_9FLAO|nr:hypothetical protein E0F91_13355 [Flavobacterium sandaracinum]
MLLVKPVLPVLEYVVNYEYISKVLCINKDKPKMQCNGKCHLMKELAKASDAEKPLSTDKKGTTSILDVLIFEEIKSFDIIPLCFGTKEKTNAYYSNLYFHLNSASVFHPPTFIS